MQLQKATYYLQFFTKQQKGGVALSAQSAKSPALRVPSPPFSGPPSSRLQQRLRTRTKWTPAACTFSSQLQLLPRILSRVARFIK